MKPIFYIPFVLLLLACTLQAEEIPFIELKGHTYGVSVLYSPDGKKIITKSRDTLYIWDAESGKKLRTLWGYSEPISSLRFSPDGKKIITSSMNIIAIWEVDSGKLLKILGWRTGWVETAAFSPDGKKLLRQVTWGIPYDFGMPKLGMCC